MSSLTARVASSTVSETQMTQVNDAHLVSWIVISTKSVNKTIWRSKLHTNFNHMAPKWSLLFLFLSMFDQWNTIFNRFVSCSALTSLGKFSFKLVHLIFHLSNSSSTCAILFTFAPPNKFCLFNLFSFIFFSFYRHFFCFKSSDTGIELNFLSFIRMWWRMKFERFWIVFGGNCSLIGKNWVRKNVVKT